VIYYDPPLAADKPGNADKSNMALGRAKEISHQTVGCAMALLTAANGTRILVSAHALR
jgi:hypothetical protein